MIIRMSTRDQDEATALAAFAALVADGILVESHVPDDENDRDAFYHRYYETNAHARHVMLEQTASEHDQDKLTDALRSFWRAYATERGFSRPSELTVGYPAAKDDASGVSGPSGRTFYVFPNAASGYRVLCF